MNNELLEKFNNELNKGMKGLMAEGIYPNTFAFILGKYQLVKKLAKEFDINVKFDYRGDKEKGWVIYVKSIIGNRLMKWGILDKNWLIKIFGFINKVPGFLKPEWIYEMDGHKFLMDERDIRMRDILKDYTLLKIWEPETTKIVKENVKPGDVCIDIGGSVGYFTLLFARQVGSTGKVFTFEPTEMNYNYQCENIRLNGYEDRCMNFKMAAWDKFEVVRVPVCAPREASCWANGVPVGEFLKRMGQERVDFIKLDVDGCEPAVLRGLIPIFEANPQVKMVVEYYPRYILDGGFSPEDFMETLNKYFTYEVIPGDYTDGCWNYFCKRKL